MASRGGWRFGAITAALIVAAAHWSASKAAAEMVLEGECDGSSAILLAPGVFAVADDDRNVLMVYKTGGPKPVATIDLITWLKTNKKNKPDTDGNPRFDETDIEASARIGNRVYWIGSHGRAGDGDPDPARDRFFATDIGADISLSPVGAPYRNLRSDLVNQLKHPFASAYRPDVGKKGPAPESDAGFNIEAMAATPNGTLLIGFRNPRPAGKAQLVELKNPAAVVETGATALFTGPIGLDLGNRGIRALEPVANGYLVLAGPHGPAPGAPDDFRLYTWSGSTTAEPAPLAVSIPASFTPEAMFVDGDTLTLLSDDGDPLIDGTPCKAVSRANMRMRALAIPLPR